MYGIISHISLFHGVERLSVMARNEVIITGISVSKERVCASLRNHRALKTEFEQSNKTGWKTQCGLLAFRISLSLSLSLSLGFALYPTYSSILYPTIPLSSLRRSPFPIGNCIKSRGSCQDLKPRPNYQLLLFERRKGNRCCWVDTAPREGGVPIPVPIGPSHFLCPRSSSTS